MIDFTKPAPLLLAAPDKEPAKSAAKRSTGRLMTIVEMLDRIVKKARVLRNTARYREKRAAWMENVDARMCASFGDLARDCDVAREAAETGRYRRVEAAANSVKPPPQPVPVPKTLSPTPPSWTDQLEESPENAQDAFFELLGKQAIRIPYDRRLLHCTLGEFWL